MKRVRISFLVLMVGLIVFYNIERVDLGTENTLNIGTYVYLITTLAAFSILLFPTLTRFHVSLGVVIWGSIYGVTKLVFFENEFLIDESLYFYLFLLEAGFITMISIMAYYLSTAIIELETTIENITLGSIHSHVKLLSEAQEEINLEIYRGRRFDTPISLLIVEIDEVDWDNILSEGVKEMQNALVQHYALNKFISSIADGFRRSDLLLADYKNNRCVILSPGTNSEGLGYIIDRLNKEDEEMKGVKIKINSAVFPDNALTFEDLLNETMVK